MVKCFFVRPSGMLRLQLRRYQFSKNGVQQCRHSYHDARAEIGQVAGKIVDGVWRYDAPDIAESDSRWPISCEHCGYRFTDKDERQVSIDAVYVDDVGKTYSLREPVPGMMYYAEWLEDHPSWCGSDGKSLHVVCPDRHTWCVDSVANNCTMKDDHKHKCWIRHGTPPMITVDKKGLTCQAGAGSIKTPGYHGFLINGVFKP